MEKQISKLSKLGVIYDIFCDRTYIILFAADLSPRQQKVLYKSKRKFTTLEPLKTFQLYTLVYTNSLF